MRQLSIFGKTYRLEIQDWQQGDDACKGCAFDANKQCDMPYSPIVSAEDDMACVERQNLRTVWKEVK